MNASYPYLTLCRVSFVKVGGDLVQVLLEPLANDQTVELNESGNKFVTVLSKVPLAPLSVWEET